MRKLVFLLIGALASTVNAQEFERYFDDATIRIDYVFGGDINHTSVYLDEMTLFDGWYGRRGNLSCPPLLGNGQLYMTDPETGDTIYANSFTTLYLEWLATDESRHVSRCYEHPILVPAPKNKTNVTLQLINMHQDVIAKMTYIFDPKDILIRRYSQSPNPHSYIGDQYDPKHAIDIAIVPEGYTEDELELFHKDAERARQAVLEHEPYKQFANRFNFVVVDVPGLESGNSLPRDNKWRKTVCGSHFDTFYTERYNTTRRLRQVHELLNGIPYEHILILTNTDIYGGGGFYNDYCIASAHAPWTLEVIVHEFGHSFGGLADEYATDNNADNYYPSDREPWEQNITTMHNFAAKWQDMLPANTTIPTPEDLSVPNRYTKIGVYEGAGYQEKGVYRPVVDCRMRVNQVKDFCPVCQRALTNLIKFYTE